MSSVSYLSRSSRTLHFSLGAAAKVDRIEVRWHAGGTNFFENLQADAVYEITEGESAPRKLAPERGVHAASSRSRSSGTGFAISPSENSTVKRPEDRAPGDKQRTLDFWTRQRAAMNALKVETDSTKAIPLFREALALNPTHEDSRDYLATCLASQGDADGAFAQLAELKRLNSQSQRAFAQWGTLRAISATSPADLQAAEESLARAHAISPEESGALPVLGEVALLRGDTKLAADRLAAACRTNAKAVGGFFLRGYLAWQRGDAAAAAHLVEDTRTALGKEWQPKGATSEGDVKQKQHVEKTPLTQF